PRPRDQQPGADPAAAELHPAHPAAAAVQRAGPVVPAQRRHDLVPVVRRRRRRRWRLRPRPAIVSSTALTDDAMAGLCPAISFLVTAARSPDERSAIRGPYVASLMRATHLPKRLLVMTF